MVLASASLANGSPPRLPVAIQSIEIETFRIEYAANPSPHIGMLFIRCIGKALEKVLIAMRTADIFRRTRVLTGDALRQT